MVAQAIRPRDVFTHITQFLKLNFLRENVQIRTFICDIFTLFFKFNHVVTHVSF